MEDPQESKYEVIITDTAEISFYEILEYLYDHYPLDRAEEIANEIRDKTKTLTYQAERGAIETRLKNRKEGYGFILYNRSKRADVKIIYYIMEQEGKVYVIDFFPTEKNDVEISKKIR